MSINCHSERKLATVNIVKILSNKYEAHKILRRSLRYTIDIKSVNLDFYLDFYIDCYISIR